MDPFWANRALFPWFGPIELLVFVHHLDCQALLGIDAIRMRQWWGDRCAHEYNNNVKFVQTLHL